VVQIESEFGLVIDATPFLCRVMPLVVENIRVNGKDVQASVMTSSGIGVERRCKELLGLNQPMNDLFIK